MSRDFKIEYEQHMNTQVPDLWASIEANLPAKEVPKVIRLEQRKGNSKRWMNYGMTAAAALLICVLAVPVLRGATNDKAEAANFMARDAAYDEICVEDAAEVQIEADMAVSDDMDDYATGGAGYATDAENGAYDVAVPERVAQETYELEASTTAEETTSDKAKETVTAMWAEVTIWEVFEEEGKVLYKADITGQEVVLALSAKLSGNVTLEVGKVYRLTLEAAEGEVWDYVIVGM